MGLILDLFSNKKTVFVAKILVVCMCIQYLSSNILSSVIAIHNHENKLEKLQVAYEEEFADTLNLYDEYINLIAGAIKKISGNDVLQAFTLYLTMQNSGLFSYGDSFDASYSGVQIATYFGVNVVLGEGVCRHQADNLYRILDAMDIKCERMIGELYIGEPSGEPNHEVVYVRYNDINYLLDPTNKTVFIKGANDEFVSVYDTDTKFKGSLPFDMIYDYNRKNIGAYFALVDQSKEAPVISDLLDKYFLESEGYISYFFEFEDENLKEIETDINDDIDRHKKRVLQYYDALDRELLPYV